MAKPEIRRSKFEANSKSELCPHGYEGIGGTGEWGLHSMNGTDSDGVQCTERRE
jgi:hypothetical protein